MNDIPYSKKAEKLKTKRDYAKSLIDNIPSNKLEAVILFLQGVCVSDLYPTGHSIMDGSQD